MHAQSLNHVWLFATLWTVACQVALSLGFHRQEYWTWLPFPTPADPLDQGLSPWLLHWQAECLPRCNLGSPLVKRDLIKQKNPCINSYIWTYYIQWFHLRSKCSKWLFKKHSVQFSSVAQSCPTLYDPKNLSMPGLPVTHQLPESTQTHVHPVSDAILPSHPLSSPSSPAPNPSQHQGLFKWVNSSHELAKDLEFQLQHQSIQWTPRTHLL